MNRIHRWLCRSTPWKETLGTHILPWALGGVDLGSKALELGPGPGLTTDWLCTRVDHLTCAEVDGALAADLSQRTAGGNVTVLWEDATALSLPDSAFDAAISVMMLHHVPSAALQDRLLAEVARVLRPGGTFAGADSVASWWLRLIHIGDVLLPIEPFSFAARLEAAGFTKVEIDQQASAFRFRAQRCD